MAKNLVIVESPGKVKSLEKFLGKDYKVMSCIGHVRDLPKGNFSQDLTGDFEIEYEVPAEKKHLVSELRSEARKADMVWLASDEDREGEAIAWHLYQVLDLTPDKTRRIAFLFKSSPSTTTTNSSPPILNTGLLLNARHIHRQESIISIFPFSWPKLSFTYLRPFTSNNANANFSFPLLIFLSNSFVYSLYAVTFFTPVKPSTYAFLFA